MVWLPKWGRASVDLLEAERLRPSYWVEGRASFAPLGEKGVGVEGNYATPSLFRMALGYPIRQAPFPIWGVGLRLLPQSSTSLPSPRGK